VMVQLQESGVDDTSEMAETGVMPGSRRRRSGRSSRDGAAVPVVAPLLALYGSGLVIEDPTLTGPFPLVPKAWPAAAHPSGGPPALALPGPRTGPVAPPSSARR